MNTDRVNPALLLESLGGFSESHYLGLFRAVDRAEVAGVLRGLNATEIHFEGNAALALGVILAPLDTGIFPRVALEQVASNTYAIDDLVGDLGESEMAPLTLAYCASLSLYAHTVTKANPPCAPERAVRALLSAWKKLGPLWDADLLKFSLWCSTLRSVRDAWCHRPVCLALSFLLLCDLLESAASQLVHEVSVSAPRRGPSLVEQTVDERFVRVLRREFESAVGPNGRVPVATQQAATAALGKD